MASNLEESFCDVLGCDVVMYRELRYISRCFPKFKQHHSNHNHTHSFFDSHHTRFSLALVIYTGSTKHFLKT